MRSFISLHKENWRSHSYAAARCVGDQVLFQMLKANSNIDTVYLCMDNDVAGQAANKGYPTNSLAKRIVRSLRRRSDRCHLS